MLISILRLPSVFHTNSVDTVLYNRGGLRISTGFDGLAGDFVRIAVSRLDMNQFKLIENRKVEEKGILLLRGRTGYMKGIRLYITGTKAGYAYIPIKYVFGDLSQQTTN